MKRLLIVSVLGMFSCSPKYANDEKLTLVKKAYKGNELKINGYYYKLGSNYKGPLTSIYFFYNNGIFLYYGSFETEDFVSLDNIASQINNNLASNKSLWGLYDINGSSLEFEQWFTLGTGYFKTIKSKCTILNDTTFINYAKIDSDGKNYAPNITYHFRQFSPKPDSTNNFIP